MLPSFRRWNRRMTYPLPVVTALSIGMALSACGQRGTCESRAIDDETASNAARDCFSGEYCGPPPFQRSDAYDTAYIIDRSVRDSCVATLTFEESISAWDYTSHVFRCEVGDWIGEFNVVVDTSQDRLRYCRRVYYLFFNRNESYAVGLVTGAGRIGRVGPANNAN